MVNRISNQKITTSPIILMLIDGWFPFVGGGQIHVKNLAATLTNKYGYRVSILYPPHPHIIIRLLWSKWVVVKILLIALKNKPHLIHSHGFITGLSAKIVSWVLNIPVVHTVHGSHLLDQGQSGIKSRLEKFLLTQIKYSAQISVSQSFKNYPNVNRKNLHIIRNGVDLAAFDNFSPKKYLKPTIVCIARNHPHKGLTYLKTAYLLAKQKIPNLQLKLYTNGRLSGQSLINAYKKAHVFVLASLAEGQPITILEAWAAKLPVIVTKVGDNPYLITPGKNGYLVKPKDTKDLCSKIIKLMTNPSLSQKLSLGGYKLVKNHYTWQHVAAATHEIYQDLIQ